MVQPIDLRLKDSMAQDYFAQMRKQQNNNPNLLQAQNAEQIVQAIEKEIEQALKNIKPELKTEEQKKKVGISGLNESLNKVTNMNFVIFQFEFFEDEEAAVEDRKKELILKVLDKETQKVLSQYPAEISIKIAKMLDQLIGRGQLADAKI